MNFEEHMINNCRQRNRKRRNGRAFDKIQSDKHRECGCDNAGNVDTDQDGPPDLDWTPHNSEDEGPPGLHSPSESDTNHEPDIDSQSQDERDTSAPLGCNYMSKTTAQRFARETLLPTSLEITALQMMKDMRLQSPSFTLMCLLTIRLSVLMMEAAGAVQDQDAIGPPCIPKPRSKPSLTMICAALDLQSVD